MVIYADVLIVLNIIVDYFLISVTGKIIKKKSKTIRIVTASIIGGLSSLYIFINNTNLLIDLICEIIFSFIISFISWEYYGIKSLLKSVLVFFVVTLSYGGIMIFIYKTFNPYGMTVKNNVVYFNMSPMILIVITLLSYLLFCIFSFVFKRTAPTAERCKIIVDIEKQKIPFNAICDSGNSLRDIFGQSEIIITDEKNFKKHFDTANIKEIPEYFSRYRAVPCATVSGTEILDGIRCDKGNIIFNNKNIELKNPVIAISKTPFEDGYNAIINPEIIE